MSHLEAKWGERLDTLQATGSLDVREIEAAVIAANDGETMLLDLRELEAALLEANSRVTRQLSLKDLEASREERTDVPLHDLAKVLSPEKHGRRGASDSLRFEELPTRILSAVSAAAQSYPARNATSLPSEVDLDEFILTLKHAAQLSISQRMAIVEFTYGTLAATRALPFFMQGAISQMATMVLPSKAIAAANRRHEQAYHWATVAALGVFIVYELVLILSQRTGPFGDEGIYIFAGMRTIEGYGLADNYLTWFAGSLLWPVVAASGYIVGGLVGARLIALACTTVAIYASARAARNLFGEPAQLWTAITLVISGPVLFLAHLAVYDQLALAGVAICLWAVSSMGRADERRWLIVAAVAFAIAVIAKYPMILCLTPLVGVVLVLRRHRAQADLFILLFASVGLLLIYVVPLREQLAEFLVWRQGNNPSFGATVATVRFSILWYGGIAWLLAAVGWVVVWFKDKNKRVLATILVGGLMLWPLYHFLINNVVSEEKHQVFGFLFGYPLIGALFAGMWLRPGAWRWVRRGALLLVLLALGYAGFMQSQQMDRSWVDTRLAAQYLASHVRPGQSILSSDAAPYQMVLYRNGNLRSPWDIYDTYRVDHGNFNGSLCAASWFVDEVGSGGWSDAVRQEITSCGTFKQVYSETVMVTTLGQSLEFVTYPVHIVVWYNVASA
jgi:hypothetical protein